ncbi:uncharacterized protein LOC104901421 isoform X2 [Beta vulgaris subsp. vulgaris]|uniref:uncharacterized protein LOC104901421 isoform X2 n=1 Tax=Beta vulgaris subsp. vulgaris TaxID=3555 RepID=UPI0020369568|nr:uncharacterized protein LOC104901421 isoform X2 [Beta vulgaris subsp. vulgaris]
MHSQSISSLSPLNFPPNSKPIKPTPSFTFSSKLNPPSSPNNSKIEIRVCTNRTCSRQGSLQILETLMGVSPAHVSINSCGCLGRCGNGPNLVVLPLAAMISHCGTAARAAELVVDVCGRGADNADLVRRSLDALAFRKRAQIEFDNHNFSEAEALFSRAYICQGDIFLAMDQLEAAEESYAMALETDPSLRRSKAFRARVQKLHEKVTSEAMS